MVESTQLAESTHRGKGGVDLGADSTTLIQEASGEAACGVGPGCGVSCGVSLWLDESLRSRSGKFGKL